MLAIIDELDMIQNKFKLDRITEKRIFIEKRIQDLDIDLIKSEEVLKKFGERINVKDILEFVTVPNFLETLRFLWPVNTFFSNIKTI